MLDGCESVLPGAAERILQMAEKEAAQRQTLVRKIVDAKIKDLEAQSQEIHLGQILGFAVGCNAIAAGAVTAILEAEVAGSFIGAGGVVGLVSVFVLGRRAPGPRADELRKSARQHRES